MRSRAKLVASLSFALALGAGLAFAPSCSRSTGGSPGAPTGTGILRDAIFYTGKYSTAATVTYKSRTGTDAAVLAYPGQVIVHFDPATSQMAWSRAIASNKGSILAKVPTLGFYLVSVMPGSEGSFISSIRSERSVRDAFPNEVGGIGQAVQLDDRWLTDRPVPLILGPGDGIVVDTGLGNHATEVADSMTSVGGTVSSVLPANLANGQLPASQVGEILAWAAASRQTFQPGQPIFVNVSISGGYLGDGLDANHFNWDLDAANVMQRQQGWQDYLQGVLDQLMALPADVRQNVVLTGILGNGGTSLTMQLQAIRALDPAYGAFLDEHTLLAESDDVLPASYLNEHPADAQSRPNGHYSNTADDPSVISISGLVLDMNGNVVDFGTSFGGPRLNAIAQLVYRQVPGLTVAQVVQAMRMANDGTPSDAAAFLARAVAAARALRGGASGGGGAGGATGAAGATGVAGSSGSGGNAGTGGSTGVSGSSGAAGSSGAGGASGASGSSGSGGNAGAGGATGAGGSTGSGGNAGAGGATGAGCCCCNFDATHYCGNRYDPCWTCKMSPTPISGWLCGSCAGQCVAAPADQCVNTCP
jgi:hypothetical protein